MSTVKPRKSRAKKAVVAEVEIIADVSEGVEATEVPANTVPPEPVTDVRSEAANDVRSEAANDVRSEAANEPPAPVDPTPLTEAKPKRVRPSRAKKAETEDTSKASTSTKSTATSTSTKSTASKASKTTGASSASTPIPSEDPPAALDAPKGRSDNVILQLNIKRTEEPQSNFEQTFYQYQPNVDIPDAYNSVHCNDYVSQPFDVTKAASEEEEVVPTYTINPTPKPKKKSSSKAAAPVVDDKKSNRVFDHLSEFIARDEWPISTNHMCFWCCHPFHNTPFGVPTKYVGGKFHVFGCLCSLECASAYNFYSTEIKHDVWESYNLLNLLSRKIEYQDIVKMAPPRNALKMFGGYMEIDEFRGHCKSGKMINTHTFPMVAMIQQLEEVNEDEQYGNRKNMFIPVDKQRLFLLESKVKLERTKPLYTNKNTLDHAMNLKIEG